MTISFSGTALMLIVLIGGTSTVLAQPSRKATRRSQPVPVSRTAPDTTATIPAEKAATADTAKKAPSLTAAPAYKTTIFDEGLPKPYDLPPAPRARMRACGLKWQALKMSGETRSDTWRDFAAKCLIDGSGTMTAR